jgi:hypothetical protein
MCINKDCYNPIENHTTGECASCGRARRKAEAEALKPKKEFKPIKSTSDKMMADLKSYSSRKSIWIKGKMCAVYPSQKATQIHHMMGRVGYADNLAKENNVKLLLDERYWLPVCMEGHQKIEEHPVWAKIRGFSIDRLSKK